MKYSLKELYKLNSKEYLSYFLFAFGCGLSDILISVIGFLTMGIEWEANSVVVNHWMEGTFGLFSLQYIASSYLWALIFASLLLVDNFITQGKLETKSLRVGEVFLTVVITILLIINMLHLCMGLIWAGFIGIYLIQPTLLNSVLFQFIFGLGGALLTFVFSNFVMTRLQERCKLSEECENREIATQS
ncbi:MAG: hypothetical protein ACFFC7_34175 [Candidatus Hermodarchaeota archaeon]